MRFQSSKLKHFYSVISDQYKKLNYKIQENRRQLVTFGVVMAVNYPLFYILWYKEAPLEFNSLPIRLAASFLCIPLVFVNYWPERLRRYLAAYWYIAVAFCLPFFFTFMTLENHASTLWLMNLVSVLFFMLLLFDLISVSILIFIGSGGAWLAFFLISQSFIYDHGIVTLPGIIATFLAAIVIGGLFSHNKDLIEKQRFKTMESLGSTMAHELRTPLAAINAAAEGIKVSLPELMRGYEYAKKTKPEEFALRSSQLSIINEVPEHIEHETQMANTVINMLLVRADPARIKTAEMKECSIVHCVEEALKRYPFWPGERELVHWEDGKDFIFIGQELLTIHVIFNLLKNGLYYVKEAGKGDIRIWLESDDKWNKLYFKDTGTGISPKVLPKIFDRFFSRTRHGAGVGLAFCKDLMQNYKGYIVCDSVEGEYTQFELGFPKLAKLDMMLKDD